MGWGSKYLKKKYIFYFFVGEKLDKSKAVKPKLCKENYGTDRDGNRGIIISWYECPNCGTEILDYIERCTSCNQLLDLEE